MSGRNSTFDLSHTSSEVRKTQDSTSALLRHAAQLVRSATPILTKRQDALDRQQQARFSVSLASQSLSVNHNNNKNNSVQNSNNKSGSPTHTTAAGSGASMSRSHSPTQTSSDFPMPHYGSATVIHAADLESEARYFQQLTQGRHSDDRSGVGGGGGGNDDLPSSSSVDFDPESNTTAAYADVLNFRPAASLAAMRERVEAMENLRLRLQTSYDKRHHATALKDELDAAEGKLNRLLDRLEEVTGQLDAVRDESDDVKERLTAAVEDVEKASRLLPSLEEAEEALAEQERTTRTAVEDAHKNLTRLQNVITEAEGQLRQAMYECTITDQLQSAAHSKKKGHEEDAKSKAKGRQLSLVSSVGNSREDTTASSPQKKHSNSKKTKGTSRRKKVKLQPVDGNAAGGVNQVTAAENLSPSASPPSDGETSDSAVSDAGSASSTASSSSSIHRIGEEDQKNVKIATTPAMSVPSKADRWNTRGMFLDTEEAMAQLEDEEADLALIADREDAVKRRMAYKELKKNMADATRRNTSITQLLFAGNDKKKREEYQKLKKQQKKLQIMEIQAQRGGDINSGDRNISDDGGSDENSELEEEESLATGNAPHKRRGSNATSSVVVPTSVSRRRSTVEFVGAAPSDTVGGGKAGGNTGGGGGKSTASSSQWKVKVKATAALQRRTSNSNTSRVSISSPAAGGVGRGRQMSLYGDVSGEDDNSDDSGGDSTQEDDADDEEKKKRQRRRRSRASSTTSSVSFTIGGITGLSAGLAQHTLDKQAVAIQTLEKEIRRRKEKAKETEATLFAMNQRYDILRVELTALRSAFTEFGGKTITELRGEIAFYEKERFSLYKQLYGSKSDDFVMPAVQPILPSAADLAAQQQKHAVTLDDLKRRAQAQLDAATRPGGHVYQQRVIDRLRLEAAKVKTALDAQRTVRSQLIAKLESLEAEAMLGHDSQLKGTVTLEAQVDMLFQRAAVCEKRLVERERELTDEHSTLAAGMAEQAEALQRRVAAAETKQRLAEKELAEMLEKQGSVGETLRQAQQNLISASAKLLPETVGLLDGPLHMIRAEKNDPYAIAIRLSTPQTAAAATTLPGGSTRRSSTYASSGSFLHRPRDPAAATSESSFVGSTSGFVDSTVGSPIEAVTSLPQVGAAVGHFVADELLPKPLHDAFAALGGTLRYLGLEHIRANPSSVSAFATAAARYQDCVRWWATVGDAYADHVNALSRTFSAAYQPKAPPTLNEGQQTDLVGAQVDILVSEAADRRAGKLLGVGAGRKRGSTVSGASPGRVSIVGGMSPQVTDLNVSMGCDPFDMSTTSRPATAIKTEDAEIQTEGRSYIGLIEKSRDTQTNPPPPPPKTRETGSLTDIVLGNTEAVLRAAEAFGLSQKHQSDRLEQLLRDKIDHQKLVDKEQSASAQHLQAREGALKTQRAVLRADRRRLECRRMEVEDMAAALNVKITRFGAWYTRVSSRVDVGTWIPNDLIQVRAVMTQTVESQQQNTHSSTNNNMLLETRSGSNSRMGGGWTLHDGDGHDSPNDSRVGHGSVFPDAEAQLALSDCTFETSMTMLQDQFRRESRPHYHTNNGTHNNNSNTNPNVKEYSYHAGVTVSPSSSEKKTLGSSVSIEKGTAAARANANLNRRGTTTTTTTTSTMPAGKKANLPTSSSFTNGTAKILAATTASASGGTPKAMSPVGNAPSRRSLDKTAANSHQQQQQQKKNAASSSSGRGRPLQDEQQSVDCDDAEETNAKDRHSLATQNVAAKRIAINCTTALTAIDTLLTKWDTQQKQHRQTRTGKWDPEQKPNLEPPTLSSAEEEDSPTTAASTDSRYFFSFSGPSGAAIPSLLSRVQTALALLLRDGQSDPAASSSTSPALLSPSSEKRGTRSASQAATAAAALPRSIGVQTTTPSSLTPGTKEELQQGGTDAQEEEEDDGFMASVLGPRAKGTSANNTTISPAVRALTSLLELALAEGDAYYQKWCAYAADTLKMRADLLQQLNGAASTSSAMTAKRSVGHHDETNNASIALDIQALEAANKGLAREHAELQAAYDTLRRRTEQSEGTASASIEDDTTNNNNNNINRLPQEILEAAALRAEFEAQIAQKDAVIAQLARQMEALVANAHAGSLASASQVHSNQQQHRTEAQRRVIYESRDDFSTYLDSLRDTHQKNQRTPNRVPPPAHRPSSAIIAAARAQTDSVEFILAHRHRIEDNLHHNNSEQDPPHAITPATSDGIVDVSGHGGGGRAGSGSMGLLDLPSRRTTAAGSANSSKGTGSQKKKPPPPPRSAGSSQPQQQQQHLQHSLTLQGGTLRPATHHAHLEGGSRPLAPAGGGSAARGTGTTGSATAPAPTAANANIVSSVVLSRPVTPITTIDDDNDVDDCPSSHHYIGHNSATAIGRLGSGHFGAALSASGGGGLGAGAAGLPPRSHSAGALPRRAAATGGGGTPLATNDIDGSDTTAVPRPHSPADAADAVWRRVAGGVIEDRPHERPMSGRTGSGHRRLVPADAHHRRPHTSTTDGTDGDDRRGENDRGGLQQSPHAAANSLSTTAVISSNSNSIPLGSKRIVMAGGHGAGQSDGSVTLIHPTPYTANSPLIAEAFRTAQARRRSPSPPLHEYSAEDSSTTATSPVSFLLPNHRPHLSSASLDAITAATSHAVLNSRSATADVHRRREGIGFTMMAQSRIGYHNQHHQRNTLSGNNIGSSIAPAPAVVVPAGTAQLCVGASERLAAVPGRVGTSPGPLAARRRRFLEAREYTAPLRNGK